jgi:predicted 3-demethylubiquinone-9 3-methyltransferase (glyoxalase superfamily)
MQKIIPSLWFENQAEEAANFYVSLFKNSKITNILRWGDAGPGPAGSVLTVDFELEGQEFNALNGGPEFKFTEALSFIVNCDTQAEVDYFWEKLTEGGEESECGWLKDRFGLSWQVVPSVLNELISGPDQARSDRVMKALLTMKRLDIARLQEAYDHE